jgi:iron complex outermembrane receptor protein
MKKTKLAISIALASACLTSIHAQANTITGQVVDGKGVPVVNGSVQIMGSNKRSLLDENGRFLFENVKAGTFELHV